MCVYDRSHRFMAIAAGFLAWLGYQTIFRARIGYVFLPFLIAFIASVIGCAGCCCLIPADPDEKSDKDWKRDREKEEPTQWKTRIQNFIPIQACACLFRCYKTFLVIICSALLSTSACAILWCRKCGSKLALICLFECVLGKVVFFVCRGPRVFAVCVEQTSLIPTGLQLIQSFYI